MSALLQTVPTTAPGVEGVPNPPAPLAQAASSKAGANHPSGGAAVM